MKTILRSSIFFLLVLVGAPESAQAGGQGLGTYDTFNGNHLDPEKWVPSDVGLSALDIRRKVGGGKAQLRLRSYAGTDSDEGRGGAFVELIFPESVGALITEIQTRVQIKKAAVTPCPTNEGASRILVPRVSGYWFNDGRSSGAGDVTGDTWASIEIRRDLPPIQPDLPPAQANRVVTAFAQLTQCNDPDCFDEPTLAFEELGKLKLPKSGVRNAKLRIKWDKARDQFIFQLNNGPPVMIPYGVADDNQPPVGGYFKALNLQANVENCDLTGPNPPKRPMAHGDVRILDVKVNDEALP